MIFDKIIDKLIKNRIEKLKDELFEHKDEILAKAKDALIAYIDEHKDEVLELIKEKISEFIESKFVDNEE